MGSWVACNGGEERLSLPKSHATGRAVVDLGPLKKISPQHSPGARGDLAPCRGPGAATGAQTFSGVRATVEWGWSLGCVGRGGMGEGAGPYAGLQTEGVEKGRGMELQPGQGVLPRSQLRRKA